MQETRETQGVSDYVGRKQERLKVYQIMYAGNKRDSRSIRLCMQETRETQGVQIMYAGNKRDSMSIRLCMKETRETQGVSDYV